MARTKLTANNHCHKPIKGGAPVEALIAAAKKGRQSCQDYLAGRHPDSVCSDNGIGAIHALVRSGSGTVAERHAMDVLLGLGATPDARNFKGQTPLLCAVNAGSWWSIPKLLAAGADLYAHDNRGETAESLMAAWLSRHPGEKDKLSEVKARFSAGSLDRHVQQPSSLQARKGPRF